VIKSIITSLLFASYLCLADAPSGYYKDAEGRTGNELKSVLHKIIDGHKPLKYTISGNDDWHDGEKVDVWEALVYTDSACPEEEPKCGLVQMLYLDESRSISKANRGGGANDAWDREHVWPKSRGFKDQPQDGYTDLHHLRPADRNVNGKHWAYGYEDGGEVLMDKLGDGTEVATTMKVNKQANSFEPSDQAKGQVARMVFYMAVRYERGDMQGDEKMPDLVIETGNQKTKEPLIGDLCTLVKWNNQFGVSDFERRRNARVQELQGNRNPFIDNAGWVNLIWGSKCS
jgi:endonuclease I